MIIYNKDIYTEYQIRKMQDVKEGKKRNAKI